MVVAVNKIIDFIEKFFKNNYFISIVLASIYSAFTCLPFLCLVPYLEIEENEHVKKY